MNSPRNYLEQAEKLARPALRFTSGAKGPTVWCHACDGEAPAPEDVRHDEDCAQIAAIESALRAAEAKGLERAAKVAERHAERWSSWAAEDEASPYPAKLHRGHIMRRREEAAREVAKEIRTLASRDGSQGGGA